eukprot:scaffold11370_cov129-Isochrysis_galbana.AAC.10
MRSATARPRRNRMSATSPPIAWGATAFFQARRCGMADRGTSHPNRPPSGPWAAPARRMHTIAPPRTRDRRASCGARALAHGLGSAVSPADSRNDLPMCLRSATPWLPSAGCKFLAPRQTPHRVRTTLPFAVSRRTAPRPAATPAPL